MSERLQALDMRERCAETCEDRARALLSSAERYDGHYARGLRDIAAELERIAQTIRALHLSPKDETP